MQRKQLVSHFFLSVYTDKQETRVRECWKENFSLVKEDWVRGHLENLISTSPWALMGYIREY